MDQNSCLRLYLQILQSQQTSHIHLSHNVSGRDLKVYDEGPGVTKDLGACSAGGTLRFVRCENNGRRSSFGFWSLTARARWGLWEKE